MTGRSPTRDERIAILETATAAAQKATTDAMVNIMRQLGEMEKHFDKRFDKMDERLTKLEVRQRAADDKLSSWENKGRGLLIGVGIAGVGFGAGALAMIERVLEALR